MSGLRRWSASWRVAARIARRDAVRARGRTALVATMIGLPILAGTAVGTLVESTHITAARQASWDLGPRGQALVEPFVGAGVVQGGDVRGGTFQPSTPGLDDTPVLADYEAHLAGAVPAGDRLVRVTEGYGDVAAAGRVAGGMAVHEAPAADLADVVVPPVADGALPGGPGEVAVSARLAARLGLHIGDAATLTLDDATGNPAGDGVPVHVSAVLGRWAVGPDVVAVQGTVLPEPADAVGTRVAMPHWVVVGDTPVTWDDVRAFNAVGSTVESRAVVADPPPAPTQVAGRQPASASTVAVVVAVAAIAFVEAVLLIGPAFAVGARRSQRQLALLAASGGVRRDMRRVVLAGGVVIGATAATAGAALGLGIAVAVRAVSLALGSFALPDLRVPWWTVPALVVFGTGVATVAAVVPARRAARVDVVAALAGRRAEATPHAAVPVVGLALAALGVAVSLVGATAAWPVVVVGGVVGLELGVVLASGGLVSLVGRLAPRLGPAGRFAVRDAARQRGRTAPALAAILAAVAGVTAALVFTQSDIAKLRAAHDSIGAVGTVAVGTPQVPGVPEPTAAQVDAAVATLRADVPGSVAVPVSVAVPPHDPTVAAELANVQGVVQTGAIGALFVERAPDQQCPLYTNTAGSPQRLTQVDTRCPPERVGPEPWSDPDTGTMALVDDGTAVRLLGVPGAGQAADALAAGKAVVASEHDLQPDGTVRLQVARPGATVGAEPTVRTVDVPAVAVDLDNLQQFRLVLPPEVAQRLGLTTRVAGLLAAPAAVPSQAQADRLAADLDGRVWQGVLVERGPSDGLGYLVWLLVVAALVVGLGATGIAVTLAAAESRPDLATLGAVGAGPRVRRRIAAAQAGVLAVTGTVLGVLAGLVLGEVLVRQRRFGGLAVDPLWTTVVPWPATAAVVVGVPLLAMGTAWACTRSRLPMVRRIAA